MQSIMAMRLTHNFYELPGPDDMASSILALLAQGNVAAAVPLAIDAANSALTVNFFESNALAAMVLSRAGKFEAALEYWDKIIRSAPHKLSWLEGGLRTAWAAQKLFDATPFINRWLDLLERVYINVPSFALLKELAQHGWSGSGCVGIHAGFLKGWFWQPVGQLPKFIGEFAQKTDFRPMLQPVASDKIYTLYSINHPLPENRGFFRIQVLDASGRAFNGSPLAVSPKTVARTGKTPKTVVPAILIPVYGDARATLACLGSVFASLKHNCQQPQIIVAWDCGPDQKLLERLRRLAQKGKIRLLENSDNMGFLASVNNAMASISGDIIWLNADTLVHGNWIDRLLAAGSAMDVATVTALGNEAELMSYPSYFDRAKISTLAQTALLDQAASQLNAQDALIEIPVGVGFCMLVTRRALKAIGGLDGVRLFRGYGEEVEFCLRAVQAGFKNLGTFNIFVGHLGERSFGAGKKALAAQNNDAIFELFPKYRKEYEIFLHKLRPKLLRQQIAENALHLFKSLPVLEIRPWSSRHLPPWLRDEKYKPEQAGRLDFTKGQITSGAALFLRPGPNARAILRFWGEITLPDMFFNLPQDQQKLRQLLTTCPFAGYQQYPAASAVLDLAQSLIKHPMVEAVQHEPLPNFEVDPGGRIVLTAPPASLQSWQKLLMLARDCPTDKFFVFFVDSLWPGAYRPENILELPAMLDYAPLNPHCFLLLDNYQDAWAWHDWLESHNAPDLPVLAWSSL